MQKIGDELEIYSVTESIASKKADEKRSESKFEVYDKISVKNDLKQRCSSAGVPENKLVAKNLADIDKTNESYKSVNSLGLAMEGKNGISMAIVAATSMRSLNNSNLKQTESVNEQILIPENYQNLVELIENLSNDTKNDKYLKMANLNRLKVISELSMKLIGRKYRELSDEEINRLEIEANRFHSSYPLPGEEDKETPIRIVEQYGDSKIEINKKFRVNPEEFVKIYTNRMIDNAQEFTGLQVNSKK